MYMYMYLINFTVHTSTHVMSCIIVTFFFSVDGAGCRQALQKLWAYLISVMATSVLKWNLVITRLGKPSTAEIRG